MNLTPQERSTVLAALREYGHMLNFEPNLLPLEPRPLLLYQDIKHLHDRLNPQNPTIPRGRPPLHADKAPQILALRKQGRTIAEIVAQLHVPRTTVYAYLTGARRGSFGPETRNRDPLDPSTPVSVPVGGTLHAAEP